MTIYENRPKVIDDLTKRYNYALHDTRMYRFAIMQYGIHTKNLIAFFFLQSNDITLKTLTSKTCCLLCNRYQRSLIKVTRNSPNHNVTSPEFMVPVSFGFRIYLLLITFCKLFLRDIFPARLGRTYCLSRHIRWGLNFIIFVGNISQRNLIHDELFTQVLMKTKRLRYDEI